MPEQIDFLQPRYETIGGDNDKSHYPYSPWELGDILAVEKDGELYGVFSKYVASARKVFEKEAKMMPHLFKLLKWWERTGVNFPSYVKDKSGVYEVADWKNVESYDVIYPDNRIRGERYRGWLTVGNVKDGLYPFFYDADTFEPATETEFTEYTNKQSHG